ncbi:hypothetical protein LTR93_009797 [Exophiala xenobiotica]|nr:hypothetical protein LTR93_009797 [Exophiala xenobiotica]KAK5402800.1 hypothetical protein LTR06_010517 [Exophiala xenobiotica]
MWLLDTTTLELCQFFSDTPPYAILSHTWGEEEVTFQEIGTPDAEKKRGYKKITQCCDLAKLEGLNDQVGAFHRSRWFKRGWTLQELLAPRHVTFFDYQWFEIGTKLTLLDNLSQITRIPHGALLDPSNVYLHSVAERMFWAAHRKTTREEDIAYCLLGIFRVNMPLLYGEGTRAFRRLQLQILSESNDHSIFAWESMPPLDPWESTSRWESMLPWETGLVSILAANPVLFRRGGIIDVNNKADPRIPVAITNLGLSMSLPIASFRDMAISNSDMKPGVDDESFIAILNCLYKGQRVGIAVSRHNGSPQWSRNNRDLGFKLIDPKHASKIAAENVLMSIEEHKKIEAFNYHSIRFLISWIPNLFAARLSDAVHVGEFEGEELLKTTEVAYPEDAPTWDNNIRYDSHSMEYTYGCLLLGSIWLAVAVGPVDGRSLTIALGVKDDRIWSSGVITHQQPQSLADIAIPMWKKVRESFSLSDPLYCQYFRDRATYKVNDSLLFRVAIKKMPMRDPRRRFYKVEISQELAPAPLAQADVVFPKYYLS